MVRKFGPTGTITRAVATILVGVACVLAPAQASVEEVSKPVAAEAQQYPHWFLEPPEDLVVGWASVEEAGSDERDKPADPQQAAFEMASRSLAIEQFVRVQSVVRTWSRLHRQRPRAGHNYIVEEDRSEAFWSEVPGQSSDSDLHLVEEDIAAEELTPSVSYVLVAKPGYTKDEASVVTRWIACGQNMPKWAVAPDADREATLVSVGMSAADFDMPEALQWVAAEEEARLRMAQSVEAHVSSAVAKVSPPIGEDSSFDYDHGRVTESVVDVVLRGARVEMRWRDAETGTCYVLVSAGSGLTFPDIDDSNEHVTTVPSVEQELDRLMHPPELDLP